MDDTPSLAHDPRNARSQEEQIRDNILERHNHLPSRTKELLEGIAKVPDPIPEDIAGKVTDFIKSITAHLKAINGARVAEKEPFLQGSRIVDGIFKTMAEPLEQGKVKIEARLGIVLRAKEERERRAAEARAQAEREAAEARRREAEEKAQREREAADRARREAEAIELKRREEAEAERRAAAERQAAHEAELARMQAEQKAAEEAAAEAERKAERARLETNRQRAAAEAARRQEEADRIEADRLEKERVAKEEAARLEKERKARERAAAMEAEERDRLARAAERSAGRAEKELDRAERREDAAIIKERRVETAKPAEFGRTRGDYGGLSTLQRHWTFANLDRAALDLELLRGHLPGDALEQAVRSFIAAGGRELRGVDIFEDDRTRVA